MLEDLAWRLHDLIAVQRQIDIETLALLERRASFHDELERLADDLYAQSQDDAYLKGAAWNSLPA
jgi:hypothetical protein